MKSLISINSKFMDLAPTELIDLIINFKTIQGVEINIDLNNEFQKKYLEDLVFELKKTNLILQIHGNIDLDFNMQLEFIKQLENYSDYLGYKIVVTMHTIYNTIKSESLQKTKIYLDSLINNIDNNKVTICLENLNSTSEYIRLGKEDIASTILENDKLFFTYDIGHEIVNHGEITNLENRLIKKIRNVHIHTYDDQGNDHCPIYKDDSHWSELTKGFNFLISNKYKYNIVYEYNLEYCYGKNIKEKITDYLKSIDFVSNSNNIT